MRESAFYRRVNDRLPKSIHHQAMTGVTWNGTLDRYYDGKLADLWVEYKAWPSMPRDGQICVKPDPGRKQQRQGRLSVNQMRWATRRWNTGKNVAVIVVLPNRRALILKTPWHWEQPVSVSDAQPVEEVAKWIIEQVGA